MHSSSKSKLIAMLVMNMLCFVIELTVGYVTKSISLVADSFHMLSDVIALIVALTCLELASKKWSRSTFGLARTEVLGALINSVFLLALCFSIFISAIQRLFVPQQITDSMLVLITGTIGLAINLFGIFIFYEHISSCQKALSEQLDFLSHSEDNINMKNANTVERKSEDASSMNIQGVFLHFVADTLGSVIVVVSAVIIMFTDWEYAIYIDPVMSILLVLIISVSVMPLASESALILMQTIPCKITISQLHQRLLKIEGIMAVHDLHIWQLTEGTVIATVHITCRDICDYKRISKQAKQMFHEEGIHSTTIQPEFQPYETVTVTVNKKEVNAEDCSIDCAPQDKQTTDNHH